jgi:hypothetical protein
MNLHFGRNVLGRFFIAKYWTILYLNITDKICLTIVDKILVRDGTKNL